MDLFVAVAKYRQHGLFVVPFPYETWETTWDSSHPSRCPLQSPWVHHEFPIAAKPSLPSQDWFRYELLARHLAMPPASRASQRWVAWVDADSFSLRHLGDVLMEAEPALRMPSGGLEPKVPGAPVLVEGKPGDIQLVNDFVGWFWLR